MKSGRNLLIGILFLSLISEAFAQGPGLGNLTYNSGELFNPLPNNIISTDPKGTSWGHGNVAMVNGYLMVVYSSDGGSTSNGGIEFWDVSNPRDPQCVVQHDSEPNRSGVSTN